MGELAKMMMGGDLTKYVKGSILSVNIVSSGIGIGTNSYNLGLSNSSSYVIIGAERIGSSYMFIVFIVKGQIKSMKINGDWDISSIYLDGTSLDVVSSANGGDIVVTAVEVS